ncbi:MAG: hypothetical protein CUN55_07835 [Phototrophicales bacterium]|nr:MAG: hypothetical protein CUN55_07835 [Phototrophicales bacterium]
MLKRFTIRQRILLTFLAIVITGSIVQLLIAGRQLQRSTLEFYQHQVETDALIIASTLSEPLEHYIEGKGTSEMERILANVQHDGGYEYLIVDRNYRVVGFTANTGYESIDRVPKSAELVAAANGAIGADIRTGHNGNDYLYVAVGVRYEEEILGYLVLSRPIAPAYAEVYQQWFELSGATLPVIGAVIIASLWLSRTISKPIEHLRNSALKMAEGDLSTRIETNAQDEVGQLARTFNYMVEQIEALMQTQRSFVSNAAHELRTPLMKLKLRVEALEDDKLSAEMQHQYLQEIQEEIDHMAGLVSSLLILAHLDEGRYKVDDQVTDTTSALHDIARHWRISATKSGLAYDAQIPDDLPNLPMTANELRLVLDNLLSNAIKYTTEGKVCFIVEQGAEQVVIKVSDTGIGFAPEQAALLFTRFYRSEQARHNFDGHGLGLSIVQAVLQQYGASIIAESDGIGKGATFTLSIPVA